MDNAQFRSLLQNGQNTSSSSPSDSTSKRSLLGSRSRPSVPMTPRSLATPRSTNGEPPTKKFKSTSAPKGTKLAKGYQDRVVEREAQTQDDREKRLKSLEEMLKLQQIDQPTFEKLREEIGVGGDLGSTHLVKGLDFKLLERVRRGEDVNKVVEKEKPTEHVEEELDEALDSVLQKEVDVNAEAHDAQGREQETEPKKATTRDELLRQLKDRRKEAQVIAAEPVLSDRFKKVATDKPRKQKFVETVDGRRREVLVVTDKDGKTKRKVKWLDPVDAVVTKKAPEKTVERLGMEIPAELAAKQKALLEEQRKAGEEDDDIFTGVGDYDPLAGVESDDEDGEKEKGVTTRAETEAQYVPSKPRNYFGTSTKEEKTTSAQDQGMLANLIKAAASKKAHEDQQPVESEVPSSERDREILERLKKRDREDALDLDLGFGESRFGDEEDDEAVILEGDKKSGRKRGPKKRKGDKDSFNDVMNVIKGRKEA